MTMTRRSIVLLSCAGAVSGCTAVGGVLAGPPRLYTLTPKSTYDEDLPTVDWQLLIEPPVAAAGLDNTRIALQRSLITLDYFADASWTDRAPQMVQTLIVESFENTGRIVSVGRDTVGLRADFILKTELREFQAEYFDDNATPTVRVHLNAKLVVMPERAIVASENFQAVQTAQSPSMEAIVLAFDTALGATLRSLVEWSLRQGEQAFQARGRPRA